MIQFQNVRKISNDSTLDQMKNGI